MDVILHLGAHRTATASFRDALRRNGDALKQAGVGVWGPCRMGRGLLAGILPQPGTDAPRAARRATGRMRLALRQTAATGVATLIISDETMIGAVRTNIRARSLYPDIGLRMARVAQTFDGRISRVVLNIRAQDLWWSSAIACDVARGATMPDYQALNTIAQSRRSWRDVITDLACALPQADLRILPFERFAGRSDAILNAGAGCIAPLPAQGQRLNRAPDAASLRGILAERGTAHTIPDGATGRWTPFTPDQSAHLRAAYASDLAWLAAGAEGLATLTQDPGRTRAGQTLPCAPQKEGQDHDRQKGRLAHSGRG
ncbi:hypothetical protein [uncultured Pseudosulfitobacter sp.]|uniref:hypothetical protein n=1 Tax=uncultured Pseudosulfitobacter sp. TaxID=2854214 RepID=UPI0030D76967|tara:strand:- start:5249 stop:6193 length:945 start_codon:yes stop_codon:yes gene_type:complete